MKMYLLKRLISLIPTLLIVSIVVYLIIYLTPGDPAEVMLGDSATDEQVEALREEMGLNDSFVQRYFTWMGGVLQGDLGTSYFMKEDVTYSIVSHLGPTLSLAILAEIFAIVIGIPIGIFAARRRGTYVDQSFMGLSYIGVAIPSFLLALFLILIFSIT
ncbi:ABC transporter permease, partial [Butyricicoccus sp. 1XD8-22]